MIKDFLENEYEEENWKLNNNFRKLFKKRGHIMNGMRYDFVKETYKITKQAYHIKSDMSQLDEECLND